MSDDHNAMCDGDSSLFIYMRDDIGLKSKARNEKVFDA
jgi:hypothetical protein